MKSQPMTTSVIASIVLLTVLAASPVATAQISVAGILDKGVAYALEDQVDGYQVLALRVDTLVRGEEDRLEFELESGATYYISVFGDDQRIQDIDAQVYDPRGKLVGEDMDETNLAIVEVPASVTGKYQVVVSAYGMSPSIGSYGVVLSTRDDRHGSVSMTPALLLTTVMAAKEESTGSEISVIHIGGITNGAAKEVNLGLLPGVSYRIIALGDNVHIQDIDLAVYDPTGTLFQEDDDATNCAVAMFEAPASGQYRIQATAYDEYASCQRSNRIDLHPDGFFGMIVARTEMSGDTAETPAVFSRSSESEDLPVGTRVVRGPDWRWSNQGLGTAGTVVEPVDEDGWVMVRWDNGERNNYRWGAGGAYDIRKLSASERPLT